MERTLSHVALFAALIAVLGFVPAVTLPFGVPITAQSLGIMLCGTVLGAKRGALAVLLFLLLVAVGLPLLSGGRGGLGVFAGPSVGFLIGFPVAAFVAGLVVERWTAPVALAALSGSVLGGIVVLYAFGIPGMALVLGKSIPEATGLALVYLPGDLIKCALAALVTRGIAQMRPGALLSRS
ncbi:biotin transporter BioY [Paragemmobacter straminiformis]|uniref:Biotin transporter n=1 Tax=Paragemmobacter straminiformis TaxID=2045119 RepID=A0A842I4M0_9RHOB|nr:biotin transporter BioY [Gemmobacter straminiformis]MBC2834347.1 biotin transporter BioY [Gemmobacter straminiformis]